MNGDTLYSRPRARPVALRATALLAALSFPEIAWAVAEVQVSDFTGTTLAYVALGVFVLAYLLAVGEESLSLRKSKPVLVGAGVIWVLVAISYAANGDTHTAAAMFRLGLEYYTELFLFLLAAMTYVNALGERGVFAVLQARLVSAGLSMRALFWVIGALTFAISPVADNLTTALLMGMVVVAVGGENRAFVVAGCINVVVAANAGGVFSPFGDVTSLMVWQRGVLGVHEFFALVAPALVNWLVPAVILSLTVPAGRPAAQREQAALGEGAWVIAGLFALTIAAAVSMERFLHMPAVIGMMTGLGLLKLYGYFLKRTGVTHVSTRTAPGERRGYDIFRSLERAEWDTLMFLYGILMSVAGLAALGYLVVASELMYGQLGPTAANVLVGVLSAFVENVPVMFTVLGMSPQMDHGQWLLVTLTAGVGGSLLSIGSAAGIAVMGQARGVYTFFAHLRWAWAVALGYAASIWVHFLVNASAFGGGA